MMLNVEHFIKMKSDPATAECYRTTHQIERWLAEEYTVLDDPKGFIQCVFPSMPLLERLFITVAMLNKKPHAIFPVDLLVEDVFPFVDREAQLIILNSWLSIPNNQKESNDIVLPMHNPAAEQHPVIKALLPNKAESAFLMAGWFRNPVHDMNDKDFLTMYTTMAQMSISDELKDGVANLKNETLLSFASKPNQPKIEHARKLIMVLALSRQADPENNEILKTWGKNQENILDVQDLIEALKLLENADDQFTLANAWFEKTEQQDPDKLIKCLPLLKNVKDQSKIATTVVNALAHNYPVHFSFTIKSFLDVLAYIAVADRYSAARNLIFSNRLKISSIDDFIRLIELKALGDAYQEDGIQNITKLYIKVLSVDVALNGVPRLCRQLYPNSEHMQVIFLEILMQEIYSPLLTRESNDFDKVNIILCYLIKKMAVSLQESDACLELLKIGKQYGIKPIDILIIANERVASRYVSLSTLLNQPAKDFITESGFAKLKQIFGECPPDMKLSGLFAYAEMNGNLKGLFVDVIDPKVIRQIEESFKPSASSPYMTSSEHTALTNVFNVEPLPSVSVLCEYFIRQKAPTPALDASIAILKASVLKNDPQMACENGYKAKLIKLLEILDEEMTDAEKKHAVGEFFDFITGVHQNAENRNKLYELLMTLRQEIVYLFSENNGITHYLALLQSLDDGCVANIAMKTKIYIYGKLLDQAGDNKQNVILYLFLCDHIAKPFFATGDMLGALASGDDADVLKNRSLRQLHISVPGLLAGIAAAFYHQPLVPQTLAQCKPLINPYDYISMLASQDECVQLYEHLSEAFPKHMESVQDTHAFYQRESNMASYLIIRKSMPELLNSRYLEEFKKDCEMWLSAAPLANNRPKF